MPRGNRRTILSPVSSFPSPPLPHTCSPCLYLRISPCVLTVTPELLLIIKHLGSAAPLKPQSLRHPMVHYPSRNHLYLFPGSLSGNKGDRDWGCGRKCSLSMGDQITIGTCDVQPEPMLLSVCEHSHFHCVSEGTFMSCMTARR